MAIILGSDPWSPSLFQSGVPIDSNDPGNSAVQRVLNAENRSWLDCRNYVFRFPGGLSASLTTNYVLNGNLTRIAFLWRGHNPVGLINYRFIVDGEYAGGTGAVVQLRENGVLIASINLAAATSTQDAFGTITPGTRDYTIQVQTGVGSTATVRNVWVTWADFT
jgi:hypothetical protein